MSSFIRKHALLLAMVAIVCAYVVCAYSVRADESEKSGKNSETKREGASRLDLPIGHKGAVTALTVSRDAEYTLTGSQDGWVILWELTSGREVRRYHPKSSTSTSEWIEPTRGDTVRSVAFSADEKTVLACFGTLGRERFIAWDKATAQVRRSLRLDYGTTLSPDGRH